MKQKSNLQEQVLDHIHRKLQERFGVAGADRITSMLSTRLCEMAGDSDATVSSDAAVENGAVDIVEKEIADGVEMARAGTTGEPGEDEKFFAQLNNIVYPFLALMQVLEELPTDAASETLRIWNTLPWTVVDKARRG